MIHIAITEDQLLFRKGMISLLQTLDNIKVCIEAENGQDLLQQLAAGTERIDVNLIDINMPVMDGIQCMKQLQVLYPEMKNIILTNHEEEKYIRKLIAEGANAFLQKNTGIEEVEEAIHAVVRQDYYFNDRTVKAMHAYMQKKKQQDSYSSAADLTRRETEILQLICREFTGPEIAQQLFISESTVNGHRNNLLLKIGCKNTAGLVLFAIKSAVFDPDFKAE